MRQVNPTMLVMGGLASLSLLLIPTPPWPPATGSPQLVSVQQLPQFGDQCTMSDDIPASVAFRALNEDRFQTYPGQSVNAAAQSGGQIVDVMRPPVRTI